MALDLVMSHLPPLCSSHQRQVTKILSHYYKAMKHVLVCFILQLQVQWRFSIKEEETTNSGDKGHHKVEVFHQEAVVLIQQLEWTKILEIVVIVAQPLALHSIRKINIITTIPARFVERKVMMPSDDINVLIICTNQMTCLKLLLPWLCKIALILIGMLIPLQPHIWQVFW